AKECVRTVAILNDDAYRKLGKNDPSGAMADFSRALSTSWNTDSYSGLVRAAYDAARFDTVVRLLDDAARDSLHRSSFSNLLLLYGDALWQQGKIGQAAMVYRNASSLDLSSRFNEALAIRLTALTDSVLV